MAKRKHLINVHTSTGTTAPTGASLYLGEIAVQHKPNDPALWIKVGTAETSTTYEKFIGSTEITNMVSAASGLVKDLSAVTLTGVTMNSSPVSVTNHVANLGTVITAETQLSTATTGTGNVVGSIGVSNHKITSTLFSAASADQISKLSGATTAHTANTTMHITAAERTRWNNAWTSGVSAYTKVEALSAGTINLVGASAATVFSSAKTYTDNEIEKLDSTGHSSDSNHYLTSVTITDGKITDIGEAQVPAESNITTATSGNGNVITNLTATGHQITMVKGITAATSAQVTTLSSATVAHINSAASHVSATDRTTWDGKQDAITDLATIRNNALSGASAYTNVNSLSAATTAHTANTTVHVTANDKTKWDAAITGVTSAGTGNAFTEYSVASNILTLTKGATYLTTAATTTQGTRADNALQTICGSTYITTNAKSGSAGAKIQTVTAKQQNVETASATGQGLADAYDVKQYVESLVTSSVDYKGATATLPTTSTVGDMYITTAQIALTAAQSATGAAQTAETGDFIIARSSGKWDVIQKNLDGAITGTLTADTVTLGSGTHTAKSLANGSNGQVLAVVSNKPAWTNAVKVNSATTADSATNATNATNAVSATTSLSANTAAALTGNITTGQVTNLTTKIQTTKVNSATTADSATNATNAVSATTSLSANVATNATKVNNHTVNSDVPSNAVFTDTKVTAVGNHYTATTATKTGGTTTSTAASAIKGITYDAAGHIVGITTGSVLTGETQLSTATTGTGNVICGITVSNHKITTLMFSAAPADALVSLSAATTAHTANTTMHVTSTERTRWNNAWTSGVSAYTKVEELSAGTIYELKQTNHNIPYVVQSGNIYTGRTYEYVAEAPEITELVDGQSIIFHPNQCSFSGTTNGSANTCSLSLQLANGTTTTPRPIYLKATTKLTNHLSGCTDVKLTYHDNATYSATTGLCGWWLDFYYDTNSNTLPTQLYGLGPIRAHNAIPRYTLAMQNSAGTWDSIVVNSATNQTSSARTDVGFVLWSDIVYYSATGLTAGKNSASGNTYIAISSFDFRYVSNCTTSAGTAPLESGHSVYLVGTVGNDGLFYLDETTWWTQTLPTTEDGKVYIYVGQVVSWNAATVALHPVHPVYEYKNGHIRIYQEDLVGGVTGTLTADTVTIGAGEHSVKSLANGANGQVLSISSNKPAWVNAVLSDSATTETGHYTPATTASTLGSSTVGNFIKTIAIDSKKHAISVTTGTALTDQTAITTGNGSSVSSVAAAVVTGVTTGGTKGHTLTLNKSNKIFSASTSDSALTVASAITSLSAQTAILGPAYNYSGIPYVNSATSIAAAYSALTNELLTDEESIAASLNDLNGRISSVSSEFASFTGDVRLEEYVIAQSLNDLNSRINELSAGTGLQELSGVVETNELVTAHALNDLNSRINELSGSTGGDASSIMLTGYHISCGSTEAELTLAGTDSVNDAFGKIQKQILDNEEAIAASLNDLNARVSSMSSVGSDLNALSGAVKVKEFVIAQALNDLNDKVYELSGATVSILPPYTAADAGKVLSVDSNGMLVWISLT